MTVSYKPDLSDAVSRIRQRIGDTNALTAKVQDETIAAYMLQGLTEMRTAARLCRDIAATYASLGDVTMDRQLSRTSQIYEHYIRLAEEIEGEDRGATATSALTAPVFVGGLNDCRTAIDDCI